MGKPGNKNQSKISNIYGRIPGANDISKDRYTDPVVPGVGSPYDQTGWQDFKKGVKKAAGKVKGYIEENYPKVAETLTSIGESSIFNPNKPSDDGWTYPLSNQIGTGGTQIRHKGDSTQVRKLNIFNKNPEWKTVKPKSSNKQTSSSVRVEGVNFSEDGGSEGIITNRYQGDEEVPLTRQDKRQNRKSIRKAKKKKNN